MVDILIGTSSMLWYALKMLIYYVWVEWVSARAARILYDDRRT